MEDREELTRELARLQHELEYAEADLLEAESMTSLLRQEVYELELALAEGE